MGKRAQVWTPEVRCFWDIWSRISMLSGMEKSASVRSCLSATWAELSALFLEGNSGDSSQKEFDFWVFTQKSMAKVMLRRAAAVARRQHSWAAFHARQLRRDNKEVLSHLERDKMVQLLDQILFAASSGRSAGTKVGSFCVSSGRVCATSVAQQKVRRVFPVAGPFWTNAELASGANVKVATVLNGARASTAAKLKEVLLAKRSAARVPASEPKKVRLCVSPAQPSVWKGSEKVSAFVPAKYRWFRKGQTVTAFEQKIIKIDVESPDFGDYMPMHYVPVRPHMAFKTQQEHVVDTILYSTDMHARLVALECWNEGFYSFKVSDDWFDIHTALRNESIFAGMDIIESTGIGAAFAAGAAKAAGYCGMTALWEAGAKCFAAGEVVTKLDKIFGHILSFFEVVKSKFDFLGGLFDKLKKFMVEFGTKLMSYVPDVLRETVFGMNFFAAIATVIAVSLVNSVVYAVSPSSALTTSIVVKIFLGALFVTNASHLAIGLYNLADHARMNIVKAIADTFGFGGFFKGGKPSDDILNFGVESTSLTSITSLMGVLFTLNTILPHKFASELWYMSRWASALKGGMDCYEKFSIHCEWMALSLLNKVGLFKGADCEAMKAVLVGTGICTERWLREVHEIELEVDHSVLNIPGLLPRVRALVDAGDTIVAALMKHEHRATFLLRDKVKNTHKRIIEILGQVQSALDMSRTKECPFVCVFAGDAGSGKSTVLPKFIDYVFDAMGVPKVGRTYPRNPGEKWWSNYARQTAVVYDDFAQIVPWDGLCDELELIKICTKNPTILPMAVAEEKGRTFHSKFIFLCTNRYCESADAPIACPEAFRRRRHFYAHVETVPGVDMGPYGIDNLRFSMMDRMAEDGSPLVGRMPNGDIGPIHQQMTFHECADLFMNQHAIFEAKEKALNVSVPYVSPVIKDTAGDAATIEAAKVAGLEYEQYVQEHRAFIEVAGKRYSVSTLEELDNSDSENLKHPVICAILQHMKDFDMDDLLFMLQQKIVSGVVTSADDDEDVQAKLDQYVSSLPVILQIGLVESMQEAERKRTELQDKSFLIRMREKVKDAIAACPWWFWLLLCILVVGIMGVSLLKLCKNLANLFKRPAASLIGLLGGGLSLGILSTDDSPAQDFTEKGKPRSRTVGRGGIINTSGETDLDCLKSIQRSQVLLIGREKGSGKCATSVMLSALPIGVRALLCTSHEIELFDLNSPIQLIMKTAVYSFIMPHGGVRYHTYKCGKNGQEMKSLLCVITLPAKSPLLEVKAKILPDFFLSGSTTEGWILPNKNVASGGQIEKARIVKDETLMDHYNSEGECWWKSDRHLRAGPATKKGDCGRPLVVHRSDGFYVVGLLVGSYLEYQGINSGCFGDVPKELTENMTPGLVSTSAEPIVDDLLGKFSMDVKPIDKQLTPMCKLVGEVTSPYPRPLRKSALQPSLISKQLAGVGIPSQMEPTLLDPKDPRNTSKYDPYVSGPLKFIEEAGEFFFDAPDTLESEALDEILMQWHQAPIKPALSGKVSWHVAINGDRTVDYCEPLPMSSSEGYPDMMSRTHATKGKRRFFSEVENGFKEPLPETLAELEAMEADFARSDPQLTHIVIGCAKDEKTKLSKIYDNPKTRMFEVLSFQFNIIMRRYFLGWMQFIMANHDSLPSKVGTNVYSESWDKIRASHARFGNHFTGDYSGFDTATPRVLMYAIVERINKLFSDEHSLIRENIIKAAANRYLESAGFLYEIHGGLPSGFAATVIMNSIVNQFYLLWSWKKIQCERGRPDLGRAQYFNEAVQISVYGDDNFVSVTNLAADYYNLRTVSELLAEKRIVLGDGAKTGVISEFIPFDDVDFLKRKFVLDPTSNGTLCPLNKTSITERLHWVRKGETDQGALETNCVSALVEAFFWGEKYFQELFAAICEAFRLANIRFIQPMPTYSNVRRWWIDQRHNTHERSPIYDFIMVADNLLESASDDIRSTGSFTACKHSVLRNNIKHKLIVDKRVVLLSPGAQGFNLTKSKLNDREYRARASWVPSEMVKICKNILEIKPAVICGLNEASQALAYATICSYICGEIDRSTCRYFMGFMAHNEHILACNSALQLVEN